MANRTVTVALKAEVAGYLAGLNTAARATKQFGKEIEAAAKADRLDKLSTSMAVVGGGMVALAGYAVKLGMDFEAGMSRVGAATNATGKELADLRALALKAGADTQFSATEAAKGITELGKAGISAKDILAGGLSGTLALAAAGEMQVAEAAETAATSMNMFHLSGSQVGHVADLLAAGANNAQGEVHDMGMALKQGGLVASQFGISIEDTVAGLTEFAAAGLIGSDAGTSFKTMLLALANPTVQSTKLMADLGIKAFDTSGKFVGLGALSEQLKTKLGGLTQAQRTQALGQIFGNDAIRAASILYEQGAKGLEDYRKKVDVAGSAAETAAKKTDNLKGDLDRLRGSLETVAIQAGSGTNDGLRILTQSADGALKAFGALPSAAQTAIVALVGLSGGALLLGSGFIKAKAASQELLQSISDVGPKGAKVAGALGTAATWAGRATLAFAGLEILNVIGGLFASEALNVDKMSTALDKVSSAGGITAKNLATAGLDLSRFKDDIKFLTTQGGLKGLEKTASFEPGFMKGFDFSAQASLGRIKDLDALLSKMAGSGNTKGAAELFDVLSAKAVEQGKSVEWLTKQFPGYASALEGAAKANSGLAQGFGDTAKNAETMTSGLQLAIDAGKSMTDIWTQLNGAVAATDDAMLKAREGVERVSDSLDKNGNALDRSSLAGLRNRVAIEGVTRAAAEASDKVLHETGSVEAASKAYEDAIGPLREVLKQHNFTDAAIQQIIDTMGKMPEFKSVPISTPGSREAQKEIDELDQEIKKLQDRKVQISQSGSEDAERSVERLQQRIDALRSKQIEINTILYEQRLYNSASEFRETRGYRWGGVIEHARSGLLKDASTFAGGPTLYAFAERATGGEAFVPRRGNYGRSMEILNRAAAWYGAQVMPMGAMGGGGNTYTINVAASVGSQPAEIGATVVQVIKKYEESNGAGWRS